MLRIVRFDETNPAPFNLARALDDRGDFVDAYYANEGMIPVPSGTVDERRDAVRHAYVLSRWKHLHGAGKRIKSFPLFPKLTESLCTLSRIALCTGRRLRQSDVIEYDLEPLYDWLCAEYEVGQFLRLENKSTKDSLRGKGRVTSPLDAIERIVTAKNAIHYVEQGDEVVHLVPWMNIEREYRVFVENGAIAAISQQDCYHTTLQTQRGDQLDPREAEAVGDARRILDWFKTLPSLYKTVTMDVAIVERDGLYHAELIECNPPTLWGPAGTSLLRMSDFNLDRTTAPLTTDGAIRVFVR